MNPEDLASQSGRMTEERLIREQDKLKEIELRMQKAINEKRQELLVRENELKELEAKMAKIALEQGGDKNADNLKKI